MKDMIFVAISTVLSLSIYVVSVYTTDSWWSILAIYSAGLATALLNIGMRMPFRDNMIAQFVFNAVIYMVTLSMFYGADIGYVLAGYGLTMQLAIHALGTVLMSEQAKSLRDIMLDAAAKR
jgi:hypothetical protein